MGCGKITWSFWPFQMYKNNTSWYRDNLCLRWWDIMVPNWKDKTINFDLAIAMKYGNKHLKMAKIQVFNVSCTFSTNFRCIS